MHLSHSNIFKTRAQQYSNADNRKHSALHQTAKSQHLSKLTSKWTRYRTKLGGQFCVQLYNCTIMLRIRTSMNSKNGVKEEGLLTTWPYCKQTDGAWRHSPLPRLALTTAMVCSSECAWDQRGGSRHLSTHFDPRPETHLLGSEWNEHIVAYKLTQLTN